MLLPPPDTTIQAGSQSPEAFVAIMTLIAIGCMVYMLGKIRLSSLFWLLRSIIFVKKERYAQKLKES